MTIYQNLNYGLGLFIIATEKFITISRNHWESVFEQYAKGGKGLIHILSIIHTGVLQLIVTNMVLYLLHNIIPVLSLRTTIDLKLA